MGIGKPIPLLYLHVFSVIDTYNNLLRFVASGFIIFTRACGVGISIGSMDYVEKEIYLFEGEAFEVNAFL